MKIEETKKGYTTVVDVGRDQNGKRVKRRFTAESRAELRQMVVDFKAEGRRYFNSTLFGDCLARYIDARDGLLSPSTVRSYRTIQRGLSERHRGLLALPVDRVNDRDVQAVVMALQRDGRTPKTMTNWVGLINAVLIEERQPPVKVIIPARAAADRPIPTLEEIKEMLTLMEGTKLEAPFRLALLGLRRGEICALAPDDLDDNNILHVHRSAVQVDGGSIIIKDTPKTDASNRYIQLPDTLAALVREKGFTQYTLNAITVAYEKFLKRHGFPPYRFHDSRHFFASYCHAQGVPEADILASGGWRDGSSIMRRVYRHSMARNKATDVISAGLNL